MKRFLYAVLLTVVIVLPAACAPSDANTSPTVRLTAPSAAASAKATAGNSSVTSDNNSPITSNEEFHITSPGIVDGFIDPAYGKNGASVENGIPTLSIPIEISGAPAATVCYALFMDDPDSEPLCGYAWVHWMAVNFTQASLPEGFSATAGTDVAQGKNDTGTVGYAGPTPPDKDHTYRITVYALDEALGLQNGFLKEQFTEALKGHVLAQATVEGIYKK